MYRTELHVHTRYSKDSILPFWLLLLMLKIKKINTVIITDHNEIRGALKFKSNFKKHNIELIVGEEIFTSNGEIIGINLKKKINSNLTPEKTITQIEKQGGLIYIPHPYDEKRYKTVLNEEYIDMFKNQIDFIEIHNGRNILQSFDLKQKQIAEKYGLRKIVGSDAHTFFEIGRNYVITKNKITENNLEELHNIIQLKESKCISFSHKWTRLIKLIKLIGDGDINEIKSIINRKCKKRK